MAGAAPDMSAFGWTHFPIRPQVRGFLIGNCLVEVFVITVVVARVYTRKFIAGGGVGVDDWFAVVSMLLGLGTLIISGLMSTLGNGYPITEVMVNVNTQLLLTFILQPLYIFGLVFSKLAVLAFYLRIFTTPRMKLATYTTVAICVIWGGGHYLAGVFICSPVATQYNLLLALSGQGVCGNQIMLFQSLIITNVLTDVIIMALPQYTIWHLNMRRSDRIGLCASFSIGLALVIVGVIRVIYVSTVNVRGDLTGTMPISIFLTVLDNQLAVVCVSIPMLRPLYAHYVRKISASRIDDSNDRYSSKRTPMAAPKEASDSKRGRSDEVELGNLDYDGSQTYDPAAFGRSDEHSIGSKDSDSALNKGSFATKNQWSVTVR